MLRPRRLLVAALALLAVGPAAPAAAAPAPPADTFADSVGVNTHLMFTRTPYWDLEKTRAALRYLGVRHLRDGIRVYGSSSEAWYMEEQAKRLGSLARSGNRLLLMLPPPDGSLGTTREALDVIAGLPGVAAVEPANEWDLKGPVATWPQEIRAQTQAAHGAMRGDAKLRRTPLAAPSFGRSGSPLTAGSLTAFVDLGNTHPYMNGTRPEEPEFPGQWSLQRNIDTMRAVSGSKPFLATETGYHNALNQTSGQLPVDPQTGAAYVLRTLLEHYRLGVSRTYLYELVDSWDDPGLTNQEANWGLFRNDWTPKPAAAAVRNLMAVVGDPRRALRGQSLNYTVTGGDANLRTLAFARVGGGFSLVLWRPEPLWNHSTKQPIAVPDVPMTVTFGKTFAGARVLRPARGPDPVQTTGTTAGMEVAVGADPVVIDLRPTQNDRFTAQVREWWCRAVPSTCPR